MKFIRKNGRIIPIRETNGIKNVAAGVTVAGAAGYASGATLKASLHARRSEAMFKLAAAQSGLVGQSPLKFLKQAQDSALQAKTLIKAGKIAEKLGTLAGAGLIGTGTNELLSRTKLKNHPTTRATVSAAAAGSAALAMNIGFRKAVGNSLFTKRTGKVIAKAVMRGIRKLKI